MDHSTIMQTPLYMTQRAVSWVRLVPITSMLALAAYHGESSAAEYGTGEDSAVPDVSPDRKTPASQPSAQQAGPEAWPQPSDPTASVTSPTAVSPSTQVQPTPVEQKSSPAPSVVAKPVEVVPSPSSTPAPNPSGPPPLTWFGVTLYGVVDVGLAHL